MISFSQLAKDAHTTAIEKGWYTLVGGKVIPRDVGEVHALFHSEISEAVEELRKPPLVRVDAEGSQQVDPAGIYFRDPEELEFGLLVHDDTSAYVSSPPIISKGGADGCRVVCMKPEGAAVEMADLLIRLGDTAQAWEATSLIDSMIEREGTHPYMGHSDSPVGQLAALHKLVSDLFARAELRVSVGKDMQDILISDGIAAIVSWIYVFCRMHNLDLERAVMLKMAYNKTRPWRHGGKKA